MIRRLVEQQQSWPREEQFRECDPHLPAARKAVGRAVEVVRRKAQAAQHRVHLRLDTVAVAMREPFLRLGVAGEQRVVGVAGDRRVRELRFNLAHLRLQREERRKGERRLVAQRPPGVRQSVLRQVADRQAGRPDDLPGVRLHLAGQHAEQCRLTRPVRAAEAHALARLHLPRDAIEQHAVAERLVKGCYLYHGTDYPTGTIAGGSGACRADRPAANVAASGRVIAATRTRQEPRAGSPLRCGSVRHVTQPGGAPLPMAATVAPAGAVRARRPWRRSRRRAAARRRS